MSKGLSIMIKPVSGACNMSCRYCFYSDVMAHRETRVLPRMGLDTLELLVRSALRYADGPVSFAFQGGEPTLAGLDFYKALIRLEKEYNTRCLPVQNSLQTNGYSLSDEMIDFFAAHHFLLGLSMDGDAAAHDIMRLDAADRPTFARVSETADRLKCAGVEFNILCVVSEYVARRPAEIFRALAGYRYLQFIACLDGFDRVQTDFSLQPDSYLRFLKTTFDLYYEAFISGQTVSIRNFDNFIGILLGLPPENCAMSGQCGQYYLLEADGSVYPCDFYVLDEYKMGNIAAVPFNRLANSAVGRAFRAESLRMPEACADCKWQRICRNGCKRERDPKTGVNRWCRVFSEFFEYSMPRMIGMAKKIQSSGGEKVFRKQ